MSHEMRDWLRKLKTQANVPAGTKAPDYVPCLSIEELSGGLTKMEVAPEDVAATLQGLQDQVIEDQATQLEELKAAALTPDEILAQCSQMDDVQYQAYMAELQRQDPEFCAEILKLIEASNAQTPDPANTAKVEAPSAPETPEAPKTEEPKTEEPAASSPALSAPVPAAKPNQNNNQSRKNRR